MTAFTVTSAFLLITAPDPTAAQGPLLASSSAPTKIILVGASTMAPQTGWGSQFCAMHVTEAVACLNLARGGRSTKTYRAEGLWDLAIGELRTKGYRETYVLIEMGHNDKSQNPSVGTDLGGEFSENLRDFVADALSAGATPVLVTPLSSRHFKSNRISDTLAPWAEKVRKTAEDTSVPLIDLNAASAALFQRLGAEGAMSFSAAPPTQIEREAARAGTTLLARVPAATPTSDASPTEDPRRSFTQDYIHLNREGAEAISALVAQLLSISVPRLKPLLIR